MKTSEFKKEIKNLGFLIEKVDDEDLYINDKYGSISFASVSINAMYGMAIYFEERPSALDNFEKKCLFDLVVRYTSTPIAEREEKKKYRLKLPNEIGLDIWICYNKENEKWEQYTNERFIGGSDKKSIFLKSELEDIDCSKFDKVEEI